MATAHSKQLAEIHPLSSIDNDLLARSWYPLVRAKDVPRGTRVNVQVLGHSLVVFRNLANDCGVLRRSCCHMGGDLSRGRVTEQGISCPIHGWEFGTDGERILDDDVDNDRVRACQPALACRERHGIVFVFFGGEVLFDVPAPEEPVFYSTVVVRDFDAHYDVPTIFGFDSEHFSTVHNRGIDEMTVYSNGEYHLGTAIRAAVNGNSLGDKIMRAVGLENIETDIDFWAANLMLGHHKRSNIYAFLASLPLGENKMRMFVTVMQKRPEGGILARLFAKLRFRLIRPIVMGFVRQDERALTGVRFDPQNSMLSDNPGVRNWLAHFQKLPKISPAKIFDAD